MSKVKYVFKWFCIMVLLFMGIRTFDNANSWIELVKGLFWIGVASVAIWFLIPPKEQN